MVHWNNKTFPTSPPPKKKKNEDEKKKGKYYHDAEDGVPEDLVDANFGEDLDGARARNRAVEFAVEPVPRRAVDQETERGHAQSPDEVVRILLIDEELGEDVPDEEAEEGGKRLGDERLRLEHAQVRVPQPTLFAVAATSGDQAVEVAGSTAAARPAAVGVAAPVLVHE